MYPNPSTTLINSHMKYLNKDLKGILARDLLENVTTWSFLYMLKTRTNKTIPTFCLVDDWSDTSPQIYKDLFLYSKNNLVLQDARDSSQIPLFRLISNSFAKLHLIKHMKKKIHFKRQANMWKFMQNSALAHS